MYSEDFNFGYTVFDNFFASFLTIFQCVSMEGWVDILYFSMDTYGIITSIILFLTLLVMGSFLVLNIVLAVLSGSIQQEEQEREEENKLKALVVDTRVSVPAEGDVRATVDGLDEDGEFFHDKCDMEEFVAGPLSQITMVSERSSLSVKGNLVWMDRCVSALTR